MSSPSQISRAIEEHQPAIQACLIQIVELSKSGGQCWSVKEQATDHLLVSVGPLDCFFREAYGLNGDGFIQFGYFREESDGLTSMRVAGEWHFHWESAYLEALKGYNGSRLIYQALTLVLASITKCEGAEGRIHNGRVLAQSSPGSVVGEQLR